MLVRNKGQWIEHYKSLWYDSNCKVDLKIEKMWEKVVDSVTYDEVGLKGMYIFDMVIAAVKPAEEEIVVTCLEVQEI
jgi:hypothetical protein